MCSILLLPFISCSIYTRKQNPQTFDVKFGFDIGNHTENFSLTVECFKEAGWNTGQGFNTQIKSNQRKKIELTLKNGMFISAFPPSCRAWGNSYTVEFPDMMMATYLWDSKQSYDDYNKAIKELSSSQTARSSYPSVTIDNQIKESREKLRLLNEENVIWRGRFYNIEQVEFIDDFRYSASKN